MPRKVLKPASAQTGNISRVSTMKWIDALKVYNAGKMWCVPRKGTPEYDEVKKIMNRTKPAEVEQRNVERREKSMEQLKALDTRKKIEERREKEASRDAVAVVKDTKTREVIDRIADINKQIEDELKNEFVSFEYDLGWKPQTKETMRSGGDRGVKFDYRDLIDRTSEMIDVAKIKQRIKELGTGKENENRVNRLNGILTNLKEWKPVNAYFDNYYYKYNTKEKSTERFDGAVKQALDDYQTFADEVNKRRSTPIRNIAVRQRINADGSRTLQASWDIQRGQYDYPYFVRQYEILPVFNFKEGATIAGMEAAERKEKEEKEVKEKDPINIVENKIKELEKELKNKTHERNREHALSKRDNLTKQEDEERYKIFERHTNKMSEIRAEISKLTRQKNDMKRERKEQKAKQEKKE